MLDEVGATKEQKDEFMKAFSETMMANITLAFAEDLDEKQKESLKKFSEEEKSDPEEFKKWMSENGVEMDEVSVGKMSDAVEKTYREFAKVVINGMDEKTKKRVLTEIQK